MAGALLAATASASATVAAEEDGGLWERFEKWREDFAKDYAESEKLARFENFAVNYAQILAENAKGLSYKLDLNVFADLTLEEFTSTRLGLQAREHIWDGLPLLGTHERGSQDLPETMDWHASGALGPVKDQGSCGSCWAFSAIGALEGAWVIATGNRTVLSEQQLVDCSVAQRNHGCQGGLPEGAFWYAQGHALCTSESYPYLASDGVCRERGQGCKVGIPQGAVAGYRDVARDDPDALMEAVMHGPVSVAIEADRQVFQLYSSGVLSSPQCGMQVNHAVLVAGYGTEGNLRYWLVRNSWSPRWGEQGYVRLLRGKGGSGECGILTLASYPVVDTAHLGMESGVKTSTTAMGRTTASSIPGVDPETTSSTPRVNPATTVHKASQMNGVPCNCVEAEHPSAGLLSAKCKDHLERGEPDWCYVPREASCYTATYKSDSIPHLRWSWCEQHAAVNAAARHRLLLAPLLHSICLTLARTQVNPR